MAAGGDIPRLAIGLRGFEGNLLFAYSSVWIQQLREAHLSTFPQQMQVAPTCETFQGAASTSGLHRRRLVGLQKFDRASYWAQISTS